MEKVEEIDIRSNVSSPNVIKFGDGGIFIDAGVSAKLVKYDYNGKKLILIAHADGDAFDVVDSPCDYAIIQSADDAQNLIKALQRAVEYGWVR